MPLFKKTSISYYTTESMLCQIALMAVWTALCAVALAATIWFDNSFQRGVAWGPELPRIEQADVAPLGVNLFLDREPDEQKIRQALEQARGLGAHWVKQLFPWEQLEPDAKGDSWDDRYGHSTWEHYDRIVALCQEYGLELIVRLDRPPPWSRRNALASPALQQALEEDPDRDISGPPDNLADYGDFVYTVVSRYRGQIRYVQLWNEPNLANEWNWAPIDPVRFVELLRIGYTRAKEANPEVVILFPSLASNDGLDPRHWSDLAFLDAVYRAGAAPYFDVMSAQLYGLGQPATERSLLGFDRQNLRLLTRTDVSRVVLQREIMERHGDGHKAIWVGELGWNATPPGWTGKRSIWGASVSEETKARYTVEALDRSLQEWPWMGVRSLWFLHWGGPPPKADDPTQFFALLEPDFTPLPGYEAVRDWAAAGIPWGVGFHDLRTVPAGEQAFLGTRLDLVLPAGSDPQEVRVVIDGQARSLTFWRDEGAESRYIAAADLSDARHTLTLGGPAGTLRGCYVVREQPFPWLFPTLTALFSLGLVGGLALLMLRLPAGLKAAWESLWNGIERFRTIPERRQVLVVLGGLALCLAVIYRPLPLPLALLALLMMAILATLRLDLATLTAVFVLPLYTQPATLAGRQFSLFELTVLVCVAAGALHVLHLLLPPSSEREREAFRSAVLKLGENALPALVFLAVCTGSLLWSTDHSFVTGQGTGLLRISLREYRTTVVEPLLLYPLLVLAFRRPGRRAWWPVDALVLSGTLVALGGIVQVFTPWMHSTVADGVRRASSVYGTFSPNALALFLGRVLTLAVAGGVFLPRCRRKWFYLAGLPVLGAAFFLTGSRGGFIALAVVLLLYGLVHSRMLLWLELAGAAAVALLAWLTGRLGRLLALDTFSNRLGMWRNTWTLVAEKPFLGLGLDSFYHHYHRRYPALEEAYFTPHNVVLEFWTRLGLLGLAAGAWLYGTFFVRVVRLYRRSGEAHLRVLALALLGSVAYALAHGLLDGTFFAPDWAATFWVAYGLITVTQE